MGLFDLFSNDTAERAASQRNEGLQRGYEALSGQFGAGRDALTTNYGNASNLYSGLLNSSNAGAGAYGDATGANGLAGQARARQNFQSDPGYGFQMDQGLQALQRTHAAAGNLNSGNADTDTLRYATGLADQSYGNYVSRLAPYLGQQSGAVQGAAGVATGLGQGLNQNYMGVGGAANANFTGQGASNAAATMNEYNVGQNQLNAIKEGGKLAANLFGAFSGGGGG